MMLCIANALNHMSSTVEVLGCREIETGMQLCRCCRCALMWCSGDDEAVSQRQGEYSDTLNITNGNGIVRRSVLDRGTMTSASTSGGSSKEASGGNQQQMFHIFWVIARVYKTSPQSHSLTSVSGTALICFSSRY
jgi:hypothetical protein